MNLTPAIESAKNEIERLVGDKNATAEDLDNAHELHVNLEEIRAGLLKNCTRKSRYLAKTQREGYNKTMQEEAAKGEYFEPFYGPLHPDK